MRDDRRNAIDRNANPFPGVGWPGHSLVSRSGRRIGRDFAGHAEMQEVAHAEGMTQSGKEFMMRLFEIERLRSKRAIVIGLWKALGQFNSLRVVAIVEPVIHENPPGAIDKDRAATPAAGRDRYDLLGFETAASDQVADDATGKIDPGFRILLDMTRRRSQRFIGSLASTSQPSALIEGGNLQKA